MALPIFALKGKNVSGFSLYLLPKKQKDAASILNAQTKKQTNKVSRTAKLLKILTQKLYQTTFLVNINNNVSTNY